MSDTITNTSTQDWKPTLAKLPRFVCQGGERPKHLSLSARWRRQNTQYVNERSKWVCLCDACFEENEAYWKDQWAEYYSAIR